MPRTRKVLCIDDNEDGRALVARAVQVKGVQFLSAADGQTGLALAASEHPDLILLDINLPDMNGLEVARRLRARAHAGRIVVLTAGDDKDRALAAGADHYMSKPIEVAELWRLLDSLTA